MQDIVCAGEHVERKEYTDTFVTDAFKRGRSLMSEFSYRENAVC